MNLNSLDCELNDAFQNPKITLMNANAISEIPEDLLFTQLSFYKNALAKNLKNLFCKKNFRTYFFWSMERANHLS